METRKKIYVLEEALLIVQRLKEQGKRIVFTNGCFDILHSGHVQYLQEARRLGDLLIVGINSDSSVRALKGRGRPILSLEDRALVLAAVEWVDMVIPFDELEPKGLIRAIVPHVLVKGADWEEEAIVGRDIVKGQGGKVVRIPLRAGISTTEIIRRILHAYGQLRQEPSRDLPGY